MTRGEETLKDCPVRSETDTHMDRRTFIRKGSVTLAGAGVAALFVVVGPRGTGQPLSDRSIRCMVDNHLDRLGLKAEGVSCHALRHSAATWARAGGARIDAIADMLGHASTDTTRIYARIVDKLTENPARYLADLMGA